MLVLMKEYFCKSIISVQYALLLSTLDMSLVPLPSLQVRAVMRESKAENRKVFRYVRLVR
jgi:hypothetical protein